MCDLDFQCGVDTSTAYVIRVERTEAYYVLLTIVDEVRLEIGTTRARFSSNTATRR